jgi:2-keto-4-pentenoate hydratase/2-oxohepta-3-ene-1,7-dioic acid hydratase in catechol pathway
MDLGQTQRGVDMGPGAIRYANLSSRLRALGYIIEDLGNIQVTQRLNGEVLQDANTKDMMFSVPFLIAYISAGMTLLPGDVISTGTPSGIGSARDPQVLMKSGDVVEISVSGIGAQRSVVG